MMRNFIGFFVAIVVAVVLLPSVRTYPALFIPRLHRTVNTMADVQSVDLGFPKTDDTVLELENLRGMYSGQRHHYHNQNKDEIMVEEKEPNTRQPQEQLEVIPTELTTSTKNTESSIAEVTAGSGTIGHKFPHLQTNDGGKVDTNASAGSDKSKASAKCRVGMHGAARLMFGQNPEIVSTTTTSKVASTAVTTLQATNEPQVSTLAATTTAPSSVLTEISTPLPVLLDTENVSDASTYVTETITAAPSHLESVPTINDTSQLNPMITSSMKSNQKTNKKEKEEEAPARQLIGDVITEAELRKTEKRGSLNFMTPKTAEHLLKNGLDQYSAFDIAQYVFWTGDETGVARAVQSLVQQNVLSSEEAIKYLHDIRLGLEYLNRSYGNRLKLQNSSISHPITSTVTSTTTTTTATSKPSLTFINFERNLENLQNIDSDTGKSLNSNSLWQNLQKAIREEQREDNPGVGRSVVCNKLNGCQRKEYDLEDVIYALAKIMFTQSLLHGTDEAQKEIQTLTEFLEREHELGVISIDLEKKVIHVLLQALTDSLAEKPELWSVAQYPYNRLLRSYAHANYIGSGLTTA